MSDMEWSRGISGYELHVDRAAATGIAPTVRLVRRYQRRNTSRDDADVDAKVHESRTRDLRRSNPGATKVQRLHEGLCEVARLGVERLREYEREIRRPVAESGIARSLERGLDGLGRAERPRRSCQLGAKEISGGHQVPDFGVPDEGFFAGVASVAFVSAGFDSLGFDSLGFASLPVESVEAAVSLPFF